MGNRCGRSSHPPEPVVAVAATPARRPSAPSASVSAASTQEPAPASASPSALTDAAMSKPDARQLSHRLKGALQLQQRLDRHLPIQPRDRGMLIAALATLYHHEEVEAREKIARERAKKRKEATAAAGEAADSAAFVAMFSEAAEDAAAAWAVAPVAAAAPAASSASAAATPALPADCQVCFSTFNTEFEGAWTLRVHMTLCGHASICSDCFRTYLTTRIQADDVMPFIGCPEPGCKMPLSHFDITACAPTMEAAHAFEVAQAKEKENAAKRDQAAVQRKAQRKLFAAKQAQAAAVSNVVVVGRRDSSSAAAAAAAASASSTTASESDDESSPAQRKSKKLHDSPKKKRAPAAGGRRKSSAAAASSDDDSAALDMSLLNLSLDGSVPQAPALTAPAAPSIAAPRPPPLLSTELLLKLTLTHLTKALRQCRDWVACGTHPLTPPAAASASAPVAPAPDAPAADASSAAPVAASSSSSSSAVPSASAVAAPSASAASTSSAAPSAPACPFGFVLIPSIGVVLTKDKLKKCEFCGLLQCVKPKTPENRVGSEDGSMESMIAEGTLRACPICQALQMKDMGMCNILQCHNCQIWWNWESRQTGKNSAALKDLARRTGTLWLPGELAFQLQLQREDPDAFKALLARNGIEFNPNYIRGSSK